MDPQVKAFIEKLTNNQFAELKGSWCNLHLEFTEKLLNEAAAMAIAMPSLKKDYPMLALINAVQVKGKLTMDVKIGA